MKYPWIEEYLMGKPGVTKDLQADWNWIRFHIGGKMFTVFDNAEHNDDAQNAQYGFDPSRR